MSEWALDFPRVIKSAREELEAVDWYNRHGRATGDEPLRRILEYNRADQQMKGGGDGGRYKPRGA